MMQINKHAMLLSALDILRFAFLGIFLLPMLGSALTITGHAPSNFRILLWLSLPQLLLPLYLGAVASGVMSDRGLRPLALVGKLLSSIPAVFTVAGLLMANRMREGMLVADDIELAMLLRVIMLVFIDLIFCIILVIYRKQSAAPESPASAPQ